MNKNDQIDSQSGPTLSDGQSNLIADNSRTYLKQEDKTKEKEAAADIIRSNINRIYESQEKQKVPTINEINDLKIQNPYTRTHQEHPAPKIEDFKQYHTAWQDYYQKYYESYYRHHLNTIKKQYEQSEIAPESKLANQPKSYFTHKTISEIEQIAKDEELFNIRQKIVNKTRESARKVRRSRHFVPLISAVVVVLLFLFLQFNRVLIANVSAYVSPGSINPQNIIVDPVTDLKVSAEPRLIIPKINVDVPVVYNIGSDYDSQMSAMANGLAHFSIPGASSHPGEMGNTVLAGHSSNDLFDSGDYKFIFAQLEKMSEGDMIYANYNSTRYTYIVTKKEVVAPTDVSKLVYQTDTPMLTLVTCTPLGTAINRLLITAKQISPNPKEAKEATISTNTTSEMPSNSPTFLERLFGAGN